MSSIKENISKNILFYRRKCGFTQKELADKLGLKHSTISAWESGANSVDTEILFKMCDIFNISLNEMYGVKSNGDFISNEQKLLLQSYDSLDPHGKKVVNSVLKLETERIEEERQQKAHSAKANNIVEISKTENEESPEIVFYESARDTYGTKDKYNTDLTPENIKKLKKLVEDAKDGELDDEYENS